MNKTLLITALVSSCTMGAIAIEHNDDHQGIANELKKVVEEQIQTHQSIAKKEIKHHNKSWECAPLNPPSTIKLQEGKRVTVESASPHPGEKTTHVILRIPTQDDPTPGMQSNLLLGFNCNEKQ